MSSALSARVTFSSAAANGSDVVVDVDRNSTLTAHTETYNVGQSVRQTVTTVSATFYAGAAQTGDVVGSATGAITINGHSLDIATILTSAVIQNVSVVDPGTLHVGDPATQLAFSATDINSNPVAVSAGSASWTVVSGGANLSVSPDGLATATEAGTATVQVTIDGVTSPAATITTDRLPSHTTLSVAVNDLAYDAVSGKLWGTVAGSTNIVGIDPATGATGPTISVGAQANLIAVTDDGQFAYVTVDADHTVRRVDLSSQTVTLTVSVVDTYVDLVTVPGSPNSFVGERDPTAGVNVSVWDDDVRRSGTGAGGNNLAFGGSNTVLYGAGGSSLFKNVLDPTSITWTEQTNGLLDGGIQYSNDGFLYTSAGSIVDPVSKTIVGQLLSTNFLIDKGHAVSDADDRVYFITWDSGIGKRMLTFDKTTRTELPMYDTGITTGGGQDLVTCGPHCVAFHLFGIGVTKNVVIVRDLP